MNSKNDTATPNDDGLIAEPLTILDDCSRTVVASDRTTKFTSDGVPPIATCTIVHRVDKLLEQGKRFACVYADLPWLIGHDNEPFVTAFSQLPVHQLVEEHAHLHLWATDHSIFAAKKVMENWGFKFKSCLVCLNSEGLPGNYWVEAHEYLLLGTRGGLPLMEQTLNSWMRSDRDQAGRASECVRELIERVSPGPYLDLFGRQRAKGWTIYSTRLETASKPESDEKLNDSKPEGEGASKQSVPDL